MNIYTGAYILAIAVNRWGMTWKAVGAYNAGFANTVLQEQRRTIYANKVYSALKAIKSRKSYSNSQELTFQKR
jgi:soluble lytic murein transglycosylase-like protein